MTGDPVIVALRAAAAARDSTELRLALARRCLELEAPAEALREAELGLALDPSHGELLDAAARAAAASGDSARASAYRLAREAHGPASDPPVPAQGEEADEPTKERPRLRLVTEADAEAAAPAPVTFADVGGLEDVKQRLNRSFLLPLKQPELFAKFGKSLRGGLLLYGPPGCGKTFIARALAGELGARFQSVGLSDVLDMWLGSSERNLHELFENARRQAPVVLFFDEVDAIGQRRTHLKHSAGRNVVNQFLAELDGVDGRNRDVFVLGATNHPWDVDTALRRPGRFDRMVFVPAPDAPARERILALKFEDRPGAGSLNLGRIARDTEGFSGADLEALANAAAELAFERAVDAGSVQPIDHALVTRALRDLRPSTRPWLETARNYAVYANEGGVYDELLEYLKKQGLA
ncbi:MAG TPA: ATP-binding protein [Myxococcota bacterium]|nr:ATP-binding protein [Myxococcota bacterium]